jgi:uncharacterized protein YecA (UPF0149 family)
LTSQKFHAIVNAMITLPLQFEKEFPEDAAVLAELMNLRRQAKEKGILFQTINVATLPIIYGRNESCPCHSGKKFKKCCGKE